MAEAFKAGSIVAMLQLDKKGWNDSVKSVDKDTGTLKDKVSKVGTTVAGVGAKFAAAGTVIVGSMFAALKKTANMGDEVAKLSQKVGISTETLSSYRVAADLSGSSLEGVAKGLQRLSGNMLDSQRGLETSVQAFDALNIKVTDSAGNMKPLDDMMVEVADRFSNMEDGATKAALAQDLFGKAGAELIPLLNQGGDALKKSREEAERMGVVFSAQAAKASEDFNDRLTELKYSLGGTTKELAMALMPAVTDFVSKVKEVVIKVREWVTAHPELAKQIGGVALKVGALMAVLGPLLMIVPKLIGGFQNMAKFLTSSAGLWMAAAAAIGYYVIKLQEKKQAEEYAEKATKRDAERTEEFRQKLEGIALAAGLTKGQFQELTDKYHGNINAMALAIKRGQEGKELQESMNKVGKERADVIEEEKKKQEALRKETEVFVPVLEDVAAKQKTWGEIMQDYGILPLKDKKEKINELLGHEEKLNQMLKDGTIDSDEYGKGIRKINDELGELGQTTATKVLPPSRDLGDLWKQAPGQISDAAYAVGDLEDQMKDYGDKMGYSTNTVKAFIYEIQRMRLAMIGIDLPPLDFSSWTGAADTAASDMGGSFDNLWSDVARGFGDSFKDIVSGASSLKEGLDKIWGNIKDSFFSMLGEIVTKWVKGLLTDMVGTATKAASGTATAFSGLSGAVSGIAGTIGTVITTLATSIATAIGAIATGIGTALVTVATAVASAATILAAAIVPLATVGALAIALYAGFKLVGGAIDKLLGLGGDKGKSSEWIHEIRDRSYDVMHTLDNMLPKFDALKASLDLTRDALKGTIDLTRSTLKATIDLTRTEICKRLNETNKALKNLKSAARGATSTQTELMAVHGKPTVPEYIIPSPDLTAMLASTSVAAKQAAQTPEEAQALAKAMALQRQQAEAAAAAAGKKEVHLHQTVNINGTMVTDREFVRNRILKELNSALKSGIGKSELKEILGV